MQALTMNHNKIYVYSNDTQRNVSMRHAATISLLNLYPKALGTFLASCRFSGSDGRRVVCKNKRITTYLSNADTQTCGIDSSNSRRDDHTLATSLLHNWCKPRGFTFGPFAAHTSYTSCKSALLPFKQSSPPFFFVQRTIINVVPTT